MRVSGHRTRLRKIYGSTLNIPALRVGSFLNKFIRYTHFVKHMEADFGGRLYRRKRKKREANHAPK